MIPCKAMDSSLAVFSTLESPFLEKAYFRSYYHPSQTQSLTQEHQHTVLSPSRLQHRNCPISEKTEVLSFAHSGFLPNSSYQEAKPTKSDSTSPFSESWPSTERSSSSLTPEGAVSLPSELALGTKSLASSKAQDSVSDSESIIARYIERFRYGEPTNRRDRRANGGASVQFWWLGQSSVPEGNTSEKEPSPSPDSSQSKVRMTLFSPELDHSPSVSSEDASAVDVETVSLQERAVRLLQRSVSPSSSSRHISSEGIGFTPTPTSTEAEADSARCIPQDVAANQHQGGMTTPHYQITQRFQACSSLKPEDDILFQWRLRRKMEEASKAVAVMPSLAWKNRYTHITSASSTVERAVPKSPEPTSCRSKSCNVLPIPEVQRGMKSTLDECQTCCCAGPGRKGPSPQQVREMSVFGNRIVTVGNCEPNENQRLQESPCQQDSVPAFPKTCHLPRPAPSEERGRKNPIPQEEGDFAFLDSPLSPGLKGTCKPLSRSMPNQAQQIVPSHERANVEARGNWRPRKSKQSPAKPDRDTREPPLNSAKHSVQRVLGEVVSERLFSPPDSPVPERHQPKRSSETWVSKQAMPSPVATPSHPQLLDVAEKLLEQAEDSDGIEFEDDPLLQALRGQREVLRNQLRAVDVRMGQLEVDRFDQNLSC